VDIRCGDPGTRESLFRPFLKSHVPVAQSKERVVAGAFNVSSGMVPRSTLTNEDCACAYVLPCETLDSKPLAS
jgi:hypothetical protein